MVTLEDDMTRKSLPPHCLFDYICYMEPWRWIGCKIVKTTSEITIGKTVNQDTFVFIRRHCNTGGNIRNIAL